MWYTINCITNTVLNIRVGDNYSQTVLRFDCGLEFRINIAPNKRIVTDLLKSLVVF